MIVNVYADDWCKEYHDPVREEFYFDNAKYLLNRSWEKGGWVNLFFASILSAGLAYLNRNTFNPILLFGYCVGILTICQLFYCWKSYTNDAALGVGQYVIVFATAFWTAFRMPVIITNNLCIVGIPLFIVGTAYMLMKGIKIQKAFEAKADEQDDFEDNINYKIFEDWKAEYYDPYIHRRYHNAEDGKKASKQYQDSANYEEAASHSTIGDPYMEQASALFEGAMNSKAELKKRYHKLAMKYHPDHGGDEELFKRIVVFYEEHVKGLET